MSGAMARLEGTIASGAMARLEGTIASGATARFACECGKVGLLLYLLYIFATSLLHLFHIFGAEIGFS